MKKSILIIMLLSFISMSCSSKDTSSEISGELKNGLRVINVKDNENMNINVYRGDYIVLNVKDNRSIKFIVPTLDINETVPKTESEKQYIKIKKSGTFNFTLGGNSGVLNVNEYSAPNYVEVSALEAVKLIENINPFILDVRTRGEYVSGHIKNASLLSVQDLSSNLDKLEQFKEEPIFLYCQSGNRSTVAARILIDEGFKHVYNLRYGIGDWKSKGLPIIK